MENGELTNVHEKTEEARFYENPNLEEGEYEQVSNQSSGDSPSPSLIAMLDNMDIRCENSKEISQQNSCSSQHGSDRGKKQILCKIVLKIINTKIERTELLKGQ